MEHSYYEDIGDVVLTAGPANWVVERVMPMEDCRLALAFRDGKQAIFDFSPYLELPYFVPLKEPSFFNKAHVECGTVVWNDDIDIAPELLHEESVPTDNIDWK